MGIKIGFTSENAGETIYALLFDDVTGNIYLPSSSTFVAYTGLVSDHAITLTEGDLKYYFTECSVMNSGFYTTRVYLQDGASPDNTVDLLLDDEGSYYDSATDTELTIRDIIINGGGGSGTTGGTGGSSGGMTADQEAILKATYGQLRKLLGKIR